MQHKAYTITVVRSWESRILKLSEWTAMDRDLLLVERNPPSEIIAGVSTKHSYT